MLDLYRSAIVDSGRSAALWMMVGFLVTYIITRRITRKIRARNTAEVAVEESGPIKDIHIGGVHVHHQVWGILLVLITGMLEFRFQPSSPWVEILAALFGIGAALALDEFALWLHLEDVYWSEEGRRSIDATVLTALVLALLMFGVRPFEIGSDSIGVLIGSIITALFVFLVVAICFLKERVMHAFVGFFVWPVALYGACRLGKPGSPWAKRRYSERNPSKQKRAEARFRPGRRTDRFKEKFRDLVGGGLIHPETDSPDDGSGTDT